MIRLNYGYPDWNKDPAKVDTASLLMREGSSGRIVQIRLEETAPDSSVFSGLYSINWQNLDRLQVEFLVPPQELLGSTEGMKKIGAMIASKKLKRHPFILRRSPGGLQTVEIFDTKEQARTAMRAYRAEQQILNLQNKKFPSDSQLEVAQLAADIKEREAAARSLTERIRMGQVEARRLQDLLSKFAGLPEAERAARRKTAEQMAYEGLALYRENKFPEAQAKFDQAVEADPENRAYYYQYGITLYRTENFNRALVFLQLAEGPTINATEREFYVALNFYRLKESANALESFEKVAADKTSELAPSARFYIGLIHYEQKRWEEAQKAFQLVLDTSKDPQLDNNAEAYLEQILRIRQFEAEKAKRWQLSMTLGEMFDSNVVSASDSSLDQGTASNTQGYRSLFQGSLRFRPIYDEKHEFAAQLDLLTMYTVDKQFQIDQNLRNSDPTVATLTAPWSYKGTLFGKGYKFDIVPGYESIYMSVEDNQNKEIVSSLILNAANLLVMSNTWFANYNLEMRRDSSKLNSSTGDNDSTAVKVKLIWNNLFFISEDKSKILTAEGDLTLNQAQGRNSIFNRLDLSVGYIQPFYWGSTANAKLAYFLLNYPEKETVRTDNSYTLSLGASKPINDMFSAGLLGSYNLNQSTDDASQYKKWMVMLTLSAIVPF